MVPILSTFAIHLLEGQVRIILVGLAFIGYLCVSNPNDAPIILGALSIPALGLLFIMAALNR